MDEKMHTDSDGAKTSSFSLSESNSSNSPMETSEVSAANLSLS
jgi:hypothetical protein